MSGPYDDIIRLPHHVSADRPQMPAENRAAQFSPFAALTGYDAAIQETARRTDTRMALEEHTLAALDMKLRLLAERVAEHPEVAVTYFRPDGKKEGGAYVVAAGAVKRIDAYQHAIVLQSGERIPIADILEITGGLFEGIML